MGDDSSVESGDFDDVNPSPVDDMLMKKDTIFLSARIATTTCLHKYAIGRMEGAQDESLPWPPLMLAVISYLCKRYNRRELVTERNLAMLELLLKVPIQLRIKRSDGESIDLNDDKSLDFRGMSFAQSLEILRDLISEGQVRADETRVPDDILYSH